MVQTYGVAPRNDADPTSSGSGETSALLGGDSTNISKHTGNDAVVPVKSEGHASIVSCVSNLSNTIIGSGAFYCIVYIAGEKNN